MGVKLLSFVLVLVLSVNIYGQEDSIVNEDEINSVSDIVSNDIEPPVSLASKVDSDVVLNEVIPPEVLTDAPIVLFRSGKYQTLIDDGLVSDGPAEVDAVLVNPNDVQSQRQLLDPTTTMTTNNDNGKTR